MAKAESPPQWTGRSIRKLSLYRRRANLGYGLEHVPFLFLYAYSLYHCLLTVGEPYAQAIRELEESGILIPGSYEQFSGGDNDVLSGLAASTLSQGVHRDEPTSAINYTELMNQVLLSCLRWCRWDELDANEVCAYSCRRKARRCRIRSCLRSSRCCSSWGRLSHTD